jgi:hypothetical protein
VVERCASLLEFAVELRPAILMQQVHSIHPEPERQEAQKSCTLLVDLLTSEAGLQHEPEDGAPRVTDGLPRQS